MGCCLWGSKELDMTEAYLAAAVLTGRARVHIEVCLVLKHVYLLYYICCSVQQICIENPYATGALLVTDNIIMYKNKVNTVMELTN